MSTSDPAEPINGGVPADREYRIAGSTVEQWSTWAGMWDTAYHALSVVDAERYVREHSEVALRTYRVAGLRRKAGADGAFEPFVVSQTGSSVENARNAVVEASETAGYDHTHIRAVMRVTWIDQKMEDLANAYWRARGEPGGTITLDNGDIDQSPKAQALWDEMGPIHTAAAKENQATLTRCGVPSKLAKLLASSKDMTLEATRLSWPGHCPIDAHNLDRFLSPPMRTVEEWTKGATWVWTDDDRLIVTACEGDLSCALYFSPEAYAAAWAEADEFYKTQ